MSDVLIEAAPVTSVPEFTEVVPGIQVARGVISIAMAQAVHDELSALPPACWELRSQDEPGIYGFGQFRVSGRHLSLADVEEDFGFSDLPLLTSVASLPLFEDREFASINMQKPRSRQGMHPDSRFQIPIDVLHFSPDGALAYLRPNGREGRIPAGPGDIIRMTDRTLMHCGINPSLETRFNMLRYNHI